MALDHPIVLGRLTILVNRIRFQDARATAPGREPCIERVRYLVGLWNRHGVLNPAWVWGAVRAPSLRCPLQRGASDPPPVHFGIADCLPNGRGSIPLNDDLTALAITPPDLTSMLE